MKSRTLSQRDSIATIRVASFVQLLTLRAPLNAHIVTYMIDR